MTDVISRFAQLRDAERASPAELDQLWAELEPAKVDDVLGRWSGGDFATGHVISDVLHQVHWVGKWFDAPLEVTPLVCRSAEGDLYANSAAAGGGAASLWEVEFRGETTATMVYDKMPVFDHFKWVDDHTLLGIMNGKLESAFGIADLYYFWLERDA